MTILIVGAGLSGAVLANLISDKSGKKVLIIDKRSEIAGNIYDYRDEETGIIVQKYGPHFFHTNNKNVWQYISKFTKWHYIYNKPYAILNGNAVNIPFNLNTIYQVFSQSMAKRFEDKLIKIYGYGQKISILKLKENEDEDLKFLSDYIYENMFKNYTIKQWGVKPEEIEPSILERVPIYTGNDNRYFHDKYQGIPAKGYTELIKNLLNHPNITIKLNTEYKNIKNTYEKVFYTGSTDEFFDYKFGKLPYRSLNFDIQKLDYEYFQKSAVVNYPNDYDFTRITEHKHFLNQKSEKTIISTEYPQEFKIGENERYYPINTPESENLYNKYKKEIENYKNIYFLGRLGNYKYYNMDKAVEKVFELYNDIF